MAPSRRLLSLRPLPLVVFSLLGLVTLAVSREQAGHEAELRRRHREDVCLQGSRRLEALIEARLDALLLVAQRWAYLGSDDGAQDEAEHLARLVLARFPGFRSVRLPPSAPVVRQTEDAPPDACGELPREQPGGEPEVLSQPVRGPDGEVRYCVTLPLVRDGAPAGVLRIVWEPARDIHRLFRHRIRSEFAFAVTDGDLRLYAYPSGGPDPAGPHSPDSSARDFPVENRRWRFVVRPLGPGGSGSTAGWTVPAFGLMLAAALALLVAAIQRQVQVARQARDLALEEIAERERAERELRASEARYRSVFLSSTDGLIVLDPDGQVRRANPAAEALHGALPGGLAGRSVLALFAPEHQAALTGLLRRLEEDGSGRLDVTGLRQDGTPFDVELRATRLTDEGRAAVLAVVTDVSERQAALRQRALLSGKVLTAQEEERARVSRDLHDGLGQLLTGLRLQLDWLRTHDDDSGRRALGEALQLTDRCAAELRAICAGLRPAVLDDLGLEPAVRQLIDEFVERTGLAVSLTLALPEAEEAVASGPVALCAYRILQEALTNVRRHAEASRVWVDLGCDASGLSLRVEDDGRGFDLKAGERSAGLGLAGMHERATLAGGCVEIESTSASGTLVHFYLPSSPEDGQTSGEEER